MAQTLVIQRGENPSILIEFFQDDAETIRLDLTGATLVVKSGLPAYATPTLNVVDVAQGIFSIPLPESVTLAMKVYEEYDLSLRAVDAAGEIHLASLKVSTQ